jgi:hypothetical protein
MDLLKAILKEHSHDQCHRIVKYIGDDKKKFADLMKLFFTGEYRVTQRAAWPVSVCVEHHPELIKPYFKKILNYMRQPGTHEAVWRNIVRLLQFVEIPKTHQGQVMNSCFEFISDPQTPIAIKADSLTVLDNLSRSYPEIKPELKLIIEERWEHETAAFRSRARKILQRL